MWGAYAIKYYIVTSEILSDWIINISKLNYYLIIFLLIADTIMSCIQYNCPGQCCNLYGFCPNSLSSDPSARACYYWYWDVWSFWWIYFVIVIGCLIFICIIACIVACVRSRNASMRAQDTVIIN